MMKMAGIEIIEEKPWFLWQYDSNYIRENV
jgi:hypothetical protein